MVQFLTGEELVKTARRCVKHLRDEQVSAIAGYDFAGYRLAIATATISFGMDYPVNALMVRKGRKDHGAGEQIAGTIPDDRRAFLICEIVDDNLNKKALARAQKILADAGVTVDGFFDLPVQSSS